MNIKLRITLVLSFFILSLTGCQREDENAPMTPEMAKSMIKLRGFSADDAGIFKAVKANDLAVLKAFYDAGVSPNAVNEKGELLLNYAIQNSEAKTVKALIEKADVNQKDKSGNVPLHLALLNNKEDIFDALLAKNADVNTGGRDGKTENQTVLYLAVVKQREDLVQKLLDKGADPNVADSGKAVPLTEACIGAGVNTSIIKMLLDKGANPNHQEENGATPLIYIAGNKQATPQARAETIKLLLAKGADKNIKEKKGRTALAVAKEFNMTDVIELLK